MRYRYRNTNTIVESSRALDSALFTPLVEQAKEAETKEETPKEEKKTTRRKRG
jgi:hypothetical protein